MQITVWTASVIGIITSLTLALNHVLDQVPKLAAKAIKAVRAVKQVKREISRDQAEKESDA